MAKGETYYYKFKYLDGTEQEFERKDNILTSIILNPGRNRIQVDNELIVLKNVIKVTVETQTQRDEEQKTQDENRKIQRISY